MKILQVSAKIDLRLNKSASGDYDNLWPYVKEEAFNKAMNEWVRRQIHGKNQTQEGDEETTMRVDDLQVLLKIDKLAAKDLGDYSRVKLPPDYLYYKRLTPISTSGICENLRIKSHLREEANVDDLVSLPSFKFEETFHTLIGNTAHVYHFKNFKVDVVELTYYRKPKTYSFKKLEDTIEFKDDVVELVIDEACKIIASDLESFNQKTLAQERAENNN
jgi:hypothetical protein